MDSLDFKTEMWSMMYKLKSGMQKIFEPIIEKSGLTMIQAYILFAVNDEKITNISGLCKEFDMNQGNVSTLCKSMEKEGLINRVRSSMDERVVNLTITEKGIKAIECIRKESEILDSIIEEAPEEMMKTILEGMDSLYEIMEICQQKIN